MSGRYNPGAYKAWVIDDCDYEDAKTYTATDAGDAAVQHAERLYPDSDAASEFEINVEAPDGNMTSHTVYVSFEPSFSAVTRKPKKAAAT